MEEKRKWRLERLVNGVWCYWGTFESPIMLATAAWDFGRQDRELRVFEEKEGGTHEGR